MCCVVSPLDVRTCMHACANRHGGKRAHSHGLMLHLCFDVFGAVASVRCVRGGVSTEGVLLMWKKISFESSGNLYSELYKFPFFLTACGYACFQNKVGVVGMAYVNSVCSGLLNEHLSCGENLPVEGLH